MKDERWNTCRTVSMFIFLSVSSVLYAQTPSLPDSTSPAPTASAVSQSGDSQNIHSQSSPAKVSPSPSNDKGAISPEMVTALAGLWVWGVILIICILLIIFRSELKNLVKKAEQAETIQISAPGGVNFQIGKPLDIDRKADLTLSDEKKTPPSQQMKVSELTDTPELESSLVEKSIEDLRDELEEAFETNDESNIQMALQALQSATTEPHIKIVNEAIYLHKKFKKGDTSAISKLQKLTEHEIVRSVAYFHLGLAYEYANELEKALEAYRLSCEYTKDKPSKAHRIIILASCMLKMGRTLDAYKIVSGEITKTNESEILLILYKGLASLYEKEANSLHQALALEKALEQEPNNTNLLFVLAYAYSVADLHLLSLLHYETLLRFDDNNKGALNNLAIEYEAQQLPILSVASYKKASDLNNTLASANLAYRLMNAGFAEEASAVLEKAKLQNDLDPSVGTALATLSEKQTGEIKKKKTLIDGAIKQQHFLRTFSDTYFRNLSDKDENIEGIWQFEDGTDIQVNQNESIAEANWLLLGKKHQFTAAVTNRTLRLSKRKMEYSWLDNKTEKGFEKEYEGYAYLSEDNQKLFIMYLNAENPIFVTMIKKNSSESLATV